MSGVPPIQISGAQATTTTSPAAKPAAPKPAVVKAARDFEALMLRKMLTSLEKAGHVGQGAESGGSSVYSSMVVGAMADAIADAGGIGLAKYVVQSLSPAPAAPRPLASAPKPSIPLAPKTAAPAPAVERTVPDSAKDSDPTTVHAGG